MCFNCIDIFTQSLWHMNKHQLQKAKKYWPQVHTTTEAWDTSNSAQDINGEH